MSCTIDHLRVGHRVTVLQDFTDLAGVAVRAGEDANLRGLGVDFAQMEIWIELERAGVRETLRFALRADDGPRNGHMREFFEMGDAVGDQPDVGVRLPAVASAATKQEGPKRPIFSMEAITRGQLPHDTCIEELTVACECDPNFHRVLFGASGDLSVHACLRCGTVTCTRNIGDDGRFTGDAWQAYRTVELSGRAHAWLAQLPRVKVDYAGGDARWPMAAEYVRYPTLYYPADTRCGDPVELRDFEARLAREQAPQSAAERLRAVCRISSPPPDDLPDEMQGYAGLWDALQLRPTSELNDLLHHAQLRSLGSSLATESLLSRADAFDVMVRALRSDDAALRSAGFAMARDMRPVDPRLEGVLIEMLGSLSFEPLRDVPGRIVSWGRCEMIFLLAAEAKIATPEMLGTLRALMRKLARHDATLVDQVRIIIRELDPPPQNTVSIPAEFAKQFAAFPECLRKLVEAELADGNSIVEICGGFPAAPCGDCLKLAKHVGASRRVSAEGVDFYERNTSDYFGEFTDGNRHFFVLEPPKPQEPDLDMDAIRAAIEAKQVAADAERMGMEPAALMEARRRARDAGANASADARSYFAANPSGLPAGAQGSQEMWPDMDAIRAELEARQRAADADRFGQENLEWKIARHAASKAESNPHGPLSPVSTVGRFMASMEMCFEHWHDGTGYDIAVLKSATPGELAQIESMLLSRSVKDWRDVEALAAIDSESARKRLRAALKSDDHRIAIAVAEYAPHLVSDAERTKVLVAALEGSEIYGGLTQALLEVEDYHPPKIIAALFRGLLMRAGVNAVSFAGMLMFLHGKAESSFDWNHRPLFLRFNTEDRAERESAFRELCEKIGVSPEQHIKAAWGGAVKRTRRKSK